MFDSDSCSSTFFIFYSSFSKSVSLSLSLACALKLNSGYLLTFMFVASFGACSHPVWENIQLQPQLEANEASEFDPNWENFFLLLCFSLLLILWLVDNVELERSNVTLSCALSDVSGWLPVIASSFVTVDIWLLRRNLWQKLFQRFHQMSSSEPIKPRRKGFFVRWGEPWTCGMACVVATDAKYQWRYNLNKLLTNEIFQRGTIEIGMNEGFTRAIWNWQLFREHEMS